MKTTFFIAKRYLFSKKSKNIINIISFISLLGIAISTAAMVIVLSSFNGIEETVVGLYDDFDQDITIRLKKGKTMNESFFPFEKLDDIKEVESYSRVIEEVIIVKHYDKWANAKIYGVDTVFLSMSNMREKVMDSMPAKILDTERPLAMLGAGVFDKLGIYLTYDYGDYDQVSLFAPYRNAKSNKSSDAFSSVKVPVVSRFNFNKEVNDKYVVVPIGLAKELLKYNDDITFVAVSIDSDADLEDVKEGIQESLGEEFEVKTQFEKNELIYKTSRAEKLISVIVLCFIFLLATFNMIASLSMLYIEKRRDIATLQSFGANESFIFRIFFSEGMLIITIGMMLGLLFGTAICWIQSHFELLKVQNGEEDVIPVVLKTSDFILITLLILVLGSLASYVSVKFLMRKSRR